MGRIIVSEFVSVDGVMEAPGGEPGYRHTGWVARFPDLGQFAYKLEETQVAEALLLGHTTYRGFAGAWPKQEGDFADKMNAMPKYVVSSTLRDPAWHNTTVLQGPVEESVARLKAEVQGELLVAGSHTLVQALRAHDLVDEYRLMVFPIVLGSGMRVFEDSEDATELELTAARSFGSVALLTYQPARGDSTPDTSARAVDRFVKDVLKTQQ
jgi:dihydrofolate reductase